MRVSPILLVVVEKCFLGTHSCKLIWILSSICNMSLMTIISVSSCLPSSNLAPADLSFCQRQLLLLLPCFLLSSSKSLQAQRDPGVVNVWGDDWGGQPWCLLEVQANDYLGIPILSQLVHVHLLVEEKVQASLQPGIQDNSGVTKSHL